MSSAKANVIIAGTSDDARDTVVTFDNANGTAKIRRHLPAVVATTCGTAGSATVTLSGSGTSVRNLTIANTFDSAAHPEIGNNNTQAVALRALGDRQVYRNVRLLGTQDTLMSDASGNITADGSGYPRQYYVDSFIEGNVDFIFGRATAVFDRTTLHATTKNGGTIFAPSSASKSHGYLVTNSRIVADNDSATIALGRPWRSWGDGTQPDVSRGQTVIRNTWLSGGVATVQPWVDFAPPRGPTAASRSTRTPVPPRPSTPTARSSATPRPSPRRSPTSSAAPRAGTRRSDTAKDTAPAAPTVTAAAGDGQVLLDWDENIESDVVSYKIYRDGTYAGTSLTSSYKDSDLPNGVATSFTVVAVDAAGHESTVSRTVTATPALKVDATVRADGSGAYPTLQSAVDAASGTALGDPGRGRQLHRNHHRRQVNVTITGGGANAADTVLTSATATSPLVIPSDRRSRCAT